MKVPAWLRRVFYFLCLSIGLAAFAWVIDRYGVRNLYEQVKEVGWLCVAAYGGTVLMTFAAPALGWQILMRSEGVRSSFWTPLRANIMGLPINMIAPSMYLGAEPLKVFYVAGVLKVPKRRVLATVVVSKFQEFVGLVLMMIVSVFAFIRTTEVLGKSREVGLVAIALVFTAGLLILLYAILGRLRPVVWCIDRIGRFKFMKGRIDKIRLRAVELEYRIHAAFVHRWKTFMAAQGVTLLSVLSIFLRPLVFIMFLPGPQTIKFSSLCMIYIICTVINMAHFTPGGIGLHEAGIGYYFEKVSPDPGFSAHSAVAYILVGRFVDVLFLLLAVGLLWMAGLTRFARKAPEVSMDDEAGGPEEAPVPDPGMKVLKRVFLAAHHEETGKTRRFVAGQLQPRPSALRIAHKEAEEGFHLLAYDDHDALVTDTFHRTLEEALKQARDEYRVAPVEWEDVKPL